MPFSATDLLYGFVTPAAVAGVALFLLRLIPADVAQRSAATVALVGGCWAGYWLLSLGPWQPETHWHWLPWAVLMALATGPVSCARGVSSVEQVALCVLVSTVAAWSLVPTWPSLDPPRLAQAGALAGYAVILASLLGPLTKRFKGPFLPAVLAVTLLAAAIVLALSGSLRFAQIAGAGAGAMFGIGIAAQLDKKADSLRGAAMAFTLLTAGALYVGQVNSFSNVPLASFALVPLAPLALWPCTLGSLARQTGWRRWLSHAGLPAIVIALGLGLAAYAEFAE